MLTTEVENTAVTQFDRERDGLTEGIVPEHDRLVDAPGRAPRLTPLRGGCRQRVGVDSTRRRVSTGTGTRGLDDVSERVAARARSEVAWVTQSSTTPVRVGRVRRRDVASGQSRVQIGCVSAHWSGDLGRLDEHHVVEATHLTEHEVARCSVLRDLDPLRGVTQAAGLVRVDERDVRLTETWHVLGRQHLDGVLD